MNKIEGITKPLLWFMAILLAAVVAGCGGSTTASSAKAITSYTLSWTSGTPGTAAGTVIGTTIAVTVPTGTAVTSMVAAFATTGTSVTIGTPAVTQVSGTTANDFTSPVAYKVTAADGSTATYTVTVTVASATSKAITAYSLGGVTGVITGATSPYAIAVAVPTGTPVTAMVATFATTGASVTVVATGTQVSATTANDFSSPVAYTVHAADASTAVYNVTVSVSSAGATAPVLGEAARYVILASQGITGGAGSALTNGDIAVMDQARTFMTGFTPTNVPEDGLYNELTGNTWGAEPSRSYASADANPAPFPAPLALAVPHTAYPTTLALINQSRTDLGVAYSFLAADPNPGAATQVCPTELGLLTLTPGVYKTASNVGITSGTLNLDAQGNPNAVWIFSIDGTLTTAAAAAGSVAFVSGVGSAKNVYWRVAGVTTIGANSTFFGNVFAYANVDVLANAAITGSLYSTTASVTMITDVVTKAP